MLTSQVSTGLEALARCPFRASNVSIMFTLCLRSGGQKHFFDAARVFTFQNSLRNHELSEMHETVAFARRVRRRGPIRRGLCRS